MSRVAAVQSWPPLTNPPTIAPSTAAARFASSNTMNGAFPPSSSWVRFTVPLAASMIFRPVAVSPVRETRSTFGFRESSSPTSPPGPRTTLRAPAGRPASWKTLASSRLVSGVQLAGFRMTVLPVMSAGAIFQTAIMIG